MDEELAVQCPRCGGDVWFHVDNDGRGYLVVVFSEQPCGCRLTAKQKLGLWDRAEDAAGALEARRKGVAA